MYFASYTSGLSKIFSFARTNPVPIFSLFTTWSTSPSMRFKSFSSLKSSPAFFSSKVTFSGAFERTIFSFKSDKTSLLKAFITDFATNTPSVFTLQQFTKKPLSPTFEQAFATSFALIGALNAFSRFCSVLFSSEIGLFEVCVALILSGNPTFASTTRSMGTNL